MLKHNQNDFWCQVINVDERGFNTAHRWSKNNPDKYSFQDESALKKAKLILSANKVNATVFWGVRCIIDIDNLIPYYKGKND